MAGDDSDECESRDIESGSEAGSSPEGYDSNHTHDDDFIGHFAKQRPCGCSYSGLTTELNVYLVELALELAAKGVPRLMEALDGRPLTEQELLCWAKESRLAQEVCCASLSLSIWDVPAILINGALACPVPLCRCLFHHLPPLVL